MKVDLVDHGVALLGESEGRSKGLHISDLYNAYYAKVEPKRYGGEDGPNIEKMAMGLAWETYVERRLLASGIDAHRPPEFNVVYKGQTIYFSPDLYILRDDHERGGEIKLTWMSATKTFDEPKFGKWKTQTMVYGHHLRLYDWTFFIMFADGDYKKHRDPIFRAFDLTYTKRECAEEWQMLCNFGTKAGLLT